ncbi:Fic family protein [Gallibacterium salpingitidis]|uniref:Fic family protein n=1 Tax=Gallibacterium salpingitidis TaxID=505341 RepID=UPI000825E07A|nr:Fic family protein [Gallibacterium salpingitidis]
MNKSYSEIEIRDKLSVMRLAQLRVMPIEGSFDINHLKAINAYIFQDSPQIAGKFRTEVITGQLWQKERNYKGFGKILVCYSSMNQRDVQELEQLLKGIDLATLKQLDKGSFVAYLTELYKRLDYIHPFPDGNSRTLREFTRSLAEECGYYLDWTKGKQEEIYLARDLEVNNIAISRSENPNHITRLQLENQAILSHKQYKTLAHIIGRILSKY